MTFECHRSTSQPKSFRNTRAVFCWGVWLCCGEKRNQSAASTDADHRHQPSAIRHQPVLISDYQSKITAASGAVLKTHGKKQPNQHQPSLYKSHQAGGQILERLSLQLYLPVSLLLWAPLSNDEIRTASTNTSCCLVSPRTHRHEIGSCCWPSQKIQPLKDRRDVPTRFAVDCIMW